MLQGLAKGLAARLPLLTREPFAECVRHSLRWGKGFPKHPWVRHAVLPPQHLPVGSGHWGPTAAAMQLLQALPWPFSLFLLALRVYFPFQGVACTLLLGTPSLVIVVLV